MTFKLNNIKNKSILISYKCILEYIDNYDLIEFTRKYKFNRLILELDYDDLKKNKDLFSLIDLKYKKKWLVINKAPFEIKNINKINFINNLYFNNSYISNNIVINI